jgi:hypothetical protein
MIYTVNEAKLALFSPDFECEQLQHNLDSFQKLLMVPKTADQ